MKSALSFAPKIYTHASAANPHFSKTSVIYKSWERCMFSSSPLLSLSFASRPSHISLHLSSSCPFCPRKDIHSITRPSCSTSYDDVCSSAIPRGPLSLCNAYLSGRHLHHHYSPRLYIPTRVRTKLLLPIRMEPSLRTRLPISIP
jgi:hypothetical protein